MDGMDSGLVWVLVVNLVLWTGLFLYMLRLGRRLAAAEDAAQRRSTAHPAPSSSHGNLE